MVGVTPPDPITRITFETASYPPGMTLTGATRVLKGGNIPTDGLYILRDNAASGPYVWFPGAGGAWAASSPVSGFLTINFSGTPDVNGKWMSFIYNTASDLDLHYQVDGWWYQVFLPDTPLHPGPDTRRNWREYSLLLPHGTLQSMYFQGMPGDYGVDNITFGSADALA